MRSALTGVLVLALVALPLWAADQVADKPAAPAGSSKLPPGHPPTDAPPAMATTLPASPEVIATVGETKIMGKEVDEILRRDLSRIPAARLEEARKLVLSRLIMRELVGEYLKAQKIEVTEAELKEANDAIKKVADEHQMTVEQLKKAQNLTDAMIVSQVKTQKLLKAETATEKAAQFVKAHPAYFNGTTVKASHILVKVDPASSTVEQKEAIKKIEQIASDIEAKKVTFEEAAKQHSACPSSQQGGDLGEFSFAKMVPPFAMAAFDMKVDQVSGVVRTQFGLHLIKVTARTEGKEADPQAEDIAKKAMMSLVLNKIIEQSLTTAPVTITK
ncbi:MAG: Foldase protein PrsA 1 precursor [Planctomycetes bacterium ADurb.Bin126]|nr:MAG: Foldase protein PrsA 1 precursor [Planctomycetes bacterium ADurb.Bin126]HOD82249.1 peptidylprolyl isomerase [Phycisphaerae bacterium]